MKKWFQDKGYSTDFPGLNDIVQVDALKVNKDQLNKAVLISTNSPQK